MNIEDAIVSLVTANAGVTALIGKRLYPGVIPQDAILPAAAYQVSSEGREYTQDGPSHIVRPVFSFTFDARTIGEARAVAEAVRKVLNGYRGTVGTVKIAYITMNNKFDGYNLASDVHVVRQDYQVVWKEV